ncbi:polyhydroxyalkanoate depolymerase [Polaromonas naphthalenivorans]|uniref:Polyhydroxyalkanoate depolymerase, intracellular n=1 Tax=Polaromonas naphthalenivorans (strain CJ2) TaxID=365044 RepID=A1VPV4_POLNA|nr:polyhydroxyalkanoate depolymerase [Polaromonas naphthalenivorans]ABM37682.1 polyhydroxyalkanoate depolymerase, intracellular [Polaromonas naphthalenivorans CJ2]
MLYQLYESQRTLMEPFVDFAQAAAKLYGSPLSPMGKTPLAQRVSAGYSLMYRLGKDYEKPSFDIHQVDVDKAGVSLAIHERVEVDKPFCELRRFKRFTDDSATLTQLKDQPAVLVVAPLSGHYSTLLRDTVKTMLKDHKVYITDWKNARNVPLSDGAFHLDDYVNYVQEFIRHLQGKYGNCHVISVCQPTVPVFAAISLMASRGEKTPLSMIMMGGPIDARRSPTAVNNLATTKPYEWFENNVIYRVPGSFAGKGRRVYPGFLQHTGFVAMNPDRHASSHYDYFKNLIKGDDASTEAHRKFYDEYNAVLDMDADYYLETIKTVFQDFKLVNGTWDVMSAEGKLERVKPGDIKTTAVMTVEGELDDISGSGQTRAALDMCSGVVQEQKTHLEAKGAGHYGIFSGRRWRDIVYPAVKAFILEHNKPFAQPEQALEATKKIAKSARAAKAAAPVTVEAPAKPASVEAAKPVAGLRTAAEAAKLKSTVAQLVADAEEKTVAKPAEPVAQAIQPADSLTATESKPAAKPVLVAVKNTTAKTEAVAEAAAQATTAPVASTTAAPVAASEAAANTPQPPEKSAA